jgi:hypothetical protein
LQVQMFVSTAKAAGGGFAFRKNVHPWFLSARSPATTACVSPLTFRRTVLMNCLISAEFDFTLSRSRVQTLCRQWLVRLGPGIRIGRKRHATMNVDILPSFRYLAVHSARSQHAGKNRRCRKASGRAGKATGKSVRFCRRQFPFVVISLRRKKHGKAHGSEVLETFMPTVGERQKT